MGVMDDPHRPILLAKQVSEIDGIGGIGWIGIERPFDVPDGAPVTGSAVMAAMRGQRHKGFANKIRHEQGGTARPAMDKCGFDRLAEILFGSHVHDRIMYEDAIEDPSKANGFHRSEEHTSELQSQSNLVCRLLL